MWYLPGAKRGSRIPTLGPKYILYSYWTLVANGVLRAYLKSLKRANQTPSRETCPCTPPLIPIILP